jgi:FtsP/CotA-like multicopper oxidase with cupredoxin domain
VIALLACTGDPAPAGRAGPVAVDDGLLHSPPELAGDVLTAARKGEGYAYNGQNPGPTVRVSVGDTVSLTLDNQLADDTTIHWHGLRVPEAMDGAGWLDDPVPAGGSFTYTFTVDRAGTYWYHPHLDVASQVDLGLYGAFIVDDPAEPALPDLVVVLDAPEEVDEDLDHDPATPRDWTVNGMTDPVAEIPPDTPFRLRLINASNTGWLALSWPGLAQVAGDQGLWGAAIEAEQVVLAPGDRGEFVVRTAEDVEVMRAPWSVAGGGAWGDPARLFTLRPAGEPRTADSLVGDGEVPSADPGWTDVTWVLAGSGPEDWLIDGESWPDVTPTELATGGQAVAEVRNLSAQLHPFHVHGHRFEVLSIDGVAPASRTVEDTVDVGIRSRVRLLLDLDNPGDWLAHCHVLGHEDGGMMTVIEER